MGICEKCKNEYDKTFEVTIDGKSHTFDSFECAISLLAPQCEVCGVKIIGHGVESKSKIFCCANCSEMAGEEGLRDRAEANP